MKRFARRYWNLLLCTCLLLGATGAATAPSFDAGFQILKGALCSASTPSRRQTQSPIRKLASQKFSPKRLFTSAMADEPPVCGLQPTQYHTIQEAVSAGDLTVALQVLMNQSTPSGYAGPLCYSYNSVPEAPVIRVRPGHRLTINLTNAIDAQDSDYNCAIDTFSDGGTCLTPVAQPTGTPGPDGSFYPIQGGVRHAATGITSLHVHGLNVSPKTCHDEVIHTEIYPENFPDDGDDLPSCQTAPNVFNYTYDIPSDEPAGLYWYHSHMHGESEPQVMMGLSGAIVIEDEEDDRRRALGIGDNVLIVRDVPAPGGILHPSPLTAPSFHPARGAATGVGGARDAGHPGVNIDPLVDSANESACEPGESADGEAVATNITLNGAAVPEETQAPPPDSALLQMQMQTGERRLWRLLNASANTYVAPELLLVQNGKTTKLPLTIVARDGVPVADDAGNRHFDRRGGKPILMAPGNRLEFLVHAPPPGAKLYLDSEDVVVGCVGNANPARRLLMVTSTGPKVSNPPDDDHDIAPHSVNKQYTGILKAKPTVFRTLEFTEYPRSFTIPLTNWDPSPPTQVTGEAQDAYITETFASDGSANPVALIPYQMDGSTPNITVHLNGQSEVTEEWTLQNYTDEIHAFHMHQVHFRVMTDEADGKPLMDVINIPAAVQERSGLPGAPGQVKIKLTFTAALAGEFVYHCHILEHEDNGMMGKILVLK